MNSTHRPYHTRISATRIRLRLVVNASYVVDNVLAETEQGRALTAIGALDASFDQFSFVSEMQDTLLPVLARAFFKLDMVTLRAMCKDTALAQIKSVQGTFAELWAQRAGTSACVRLSQWTSSHKDCVSQCMY